MNSQGGDLKCDKLLTSSLACSSLVCSGSLSGNPVFLGAYTVVGSATSPVLFAGPTPVYSPAVLPTFPAKYILVGQAITANITSISLLIQSPTSLDLLGNYEVIPTCVVSNVGIDAEVSVDEIIFTAINITITFSGAGLPVGNAFQFSCQFNPLF